MYDYSHSLATAVKNARIQLSMTQREVANAADIDDRTVLNIENGKGNPKLEVLYPLVRVLRINPNEIFYPEHINGTSEQYQLHKIIDDCTEQEAAALLSAVSSILDVIRNKEFTSI